MDRAVWVGCLFGITLIGSIAQAEGRTISVRCENQDKGKNAIVFIVTANDVSKSVTLKEKFEIDGQVEISRYGVFNDGRYGKAPTSVKVKSLDGRPHDEYITVADNDVKRQKSVLQHVSIEGSKIEFGTKVWSTTIDMNGGVYTKQSGQRGFCDYIK